MGTSVLGHPHRKVRNLVCLVAVLQSLCPQAQFHPCLYCCSHQDQSRLFITSVSAALCSHLRFLRKPSHRRVRHPPRCIFLLQKVDLPTSANSDTLFTEFICQEKYSYSHHLPTGGGKRFGQRQHNELAYVWHMSEMHSVCSLFWLPRGCLRGHLTLSMRGI